MASSSSPVSVLDEHRFHKAHNQQLFESYARRRKVIPEVGFNLNEDEYPQIMEQIALRGWRRLAAPRTNISKLLVQEFYANAAVSDEEAPVQDELPYKSFPLARGWQEFIIHSLVSTGNKSEVTTTREILIHSIMQGEDVRAEEIIADNMITIAQGLTNKGNLAHPSTIYKLCKDAGVPLREFTRTPRIPELSYITAKRLEIIRFPRNQQQANPNLSEIPITQIPDIMRTNVVKGRPLFHGFLKSDYGASSSSQVDPKESVPLRTAPLSPHFRPPHPPPN
ncbi:hypothetical protein PIB30_086960 [Stylosanthes scabra]|uniref:Putative plant transposon protein domain-containing protein n=1 Tax=Stylosanthes scabra TaxID=79078 RepID=A0ABU6TSU2_9FABA|nr:hypothetical protein [Stylosanthes scabra]